MTESKKARRRGRKSNDGFKEDDTGEKLQASLLIQLDGEKWYDYAKKVPGSNETILSHPPPDGITADLIQSFRSKADSLYQNEIETFGRTSSNKDDRWVEETLRKGTLKDRIAAMSVTVSTHPLHKLYALDGLLQLSDNSNSRVSQLAAQALEDLFLNLLPERKLVAISQRPLHLYEQKTLSPRLLLLWSFEEKLKEKYYHFIDKYLSNTLRDGAELDKIMAVRSGANLLCALPEGEAVLLERIVNKLGDPAKKVAAAAARELRRVLKVHPVMQTVVAREVQQLAHRPNLSYRALYNCITFLNQLQFRKDDEELPASLIGTYFRLFEVTVNRKQDESSGTKSRLLSALLTGVNRAHPYLPDHNQRMEEHMDALYRIVHTAPPAAGTQSLLLLFHLIIGSNQAETAESTSEACKRRDRFYRALFSTLDNPEFLGAGKHLTMYFNLLYKAMKYDTDTSRVLAYSKRIMCTTLHGSSAVLAASLFLLNEIGRCHPTLLSCFGEVLEGPDAFRVLDPTKREPRGALVSSKDVSNDKRDKKAPSWELALAAHHFHPSVVKFNKSLGNIQYDGDPLRDFALTPFLDKFAYRNPKSSEHLSRKYMRGESVAERRSGTDSFVHRQVAPPVNDPSFLLKEQVGGQDEFFHKYFMERARRDKIKGIVRHRHPENGAVAEEDAFDHAEAVDIDRPFEDFEQEWNTDSEEEAFVDSLAQDIIEDSIAAYGPDELDEEDPDMAGWDDMYDSENEFGDAEELPGSNGIDIDSDADDIVDIDDDTDDDAFMENSDSSDAEAPDLAIYVDNKHDFDEKLDGSDDSIDPVVEDSDDNSYDHKLPGTEAKGQTPTFAAMEEYEDQINSSWTQLKRKHDDEGEELEKAETQADKEQRKKGRTRKRRKGDKTGRSPSAI